MTYQLGSSDQELKRLEDQVHLYNDAQYIHFEKDMVVGEFGCGNGANLWIAKLLPQGKYIGIDIQARQIESAHKKSQEMQLDNTEFHVAEAKKIPLLDNSLDLAFCRLVLVHNPYPLELIKEMARVTKKGGRVLAIEPHNFASMAYNKPYLNKCYHARIKYMYQPSKGTIDICPQLFHLFKQANLSKILIKQHSIYCDSREPEQLKKYYKNWVVMMDNVKDQLFENAIITKKDYQIAAQEAEDINDGDAIYHNLWIAEGWKSEGAI